jgi:hypothetical protein
MYAWRNLKLRELMGLVSDGTAVLRLFPRFRISTITAPILMLAGLAAACLAFVALLAGVVWYLGSPAFTGLAVASCGILGGSVAIGSAQFLIRAIRTSACLADGEATYLMPGAFTHVLVHARLPGKVLLVKRGARTLKRHLKSLGPRQTMKDEWRVYRGLRALGIAAETWYVGKFGIRDVKIRFGGNLRLEALKGEERLIADQTLHDLVDVCIQQRGMPLNEFLQSNAAEKLPIYVGLRQVVHRMWQQGYIDLDIAFRNYMVQLDQQGHPRRGREWYEVVIHDFGSTFRFRGDADAIEKFLNSHESAAGDEPAILSNGAFLLRSLTRRRELEFSQTLMPRTHLLQLVPLFHEQELGAEQLQQRLRHHTNIRALRQAIRSVAETIAAARTSM